MIIIKDTAPSWIGTRGECICGLEVELEPIDKPSPVLSYTDNQTQKSVVIFWEIECPRCKQRIRVKTYHA